MALIRCTECGREISSSAQSCPYCGHPAQVDRGVREVMDLSAQISDIQTTERDTDWTFDISTEVFRLVFVVSGIVCVAVAGFGAARSLLAWLGLAAFILCIAFSVRYRTLKRKRESARSKRDALLRKLPP